MSENIRPIQEAKAWYDAEELPTECPFAAEMKGHRIGSSLALEDISENKPEFYGRLAKVIEPIIKEAYESYQKSGGFRVSDENIIMPNDLEKHQLVVKWEDSLSYFTKKEMTLLRDNEDLANKQILQATIDARNPHLNEQDKILLSATAERWGNLSDLIKGGIDTSVSATEKLSLRANSFLLRSGFYDPRERSSIIENSHGLLVKLASLHLYKLESLNEQYLNENDEKKRFLPFEFVGEKALRFSPLGMDNLQIVGVTPDIIGLLKDMELPDVEIGCPVLRIRGLTKNIWRWGVEIMDKAGLFDAETSSFDAVN